MREPRCSAAGFALAEILIGLLVGIVGLSGVYIATLECSRMRRSDAETCCALQACRERLEQIRGLPFDQVAAQNGSGFVVDADSDGVPDLRPAPDDKDGQPGFVAVSPERTAGGDTLYRVTATVTWQGHGGRRSMWLETFLANRTGQ